jgi:iron complex transport system substrate-binding protein
MKRLSILTLLALTLLVAACPLFAEGAAEAPAEATAPNAGEYPRTFTDDAGNTVVLKAKPVRIASITLMTDEILLSLVDRDRLVGVSTFSTDPIVSNVVEEAKKVDTALTLNVEHIIALEPDLVLLADWSDAAAVTQLRGAGLPIYLVSTPTNTTEVKETIRTLAKLVGEPAAGESLVSWMDERIRGVRDKVEDIPETQRLTVMDYNTWGTSGGHGSSWNHLVTTAGLVNVVADLDTDDWGYVPVSKELLVELDPDVLVLPGWIYGEENGAEKFKRSIVEDPALQSMAAIREDRVYQIPERLRSAVSQYMVLGIRSLAELAYPDRF